MAKNVTPWYSDDGSTTYSPSNVAVQRLETDNTIRTEQDGTIRVLEDAQATAKSQTTWSEA